MVSIAMFLLVQNFNSLIFSHGHPAWEFNVRERPLMTSDFMVGRGVQNDPKNWTF